MAQVTFTAHLARHVPCPPRSATGFTWQEALEAYFAEALRLRGHVPDEQGVRRNHVGFSSTENSSPREARLGQPVLPQYSPLLFLEESSMKHLGIAVVAPLTLALALAGCGGINDTGDLFQAVGAGGASTAGPAQSSNANTATSTATATSGSAGASTSGASTSGTSTGTGVSGGGVYCDGSPCASGDICCFTSTGASSHCGHTGTCGDGAMELACNGPEDCPGAICCADVDLQMQVPYLGIRCQASCSGSNRRIMCGDADVSGCPQGMTCTVSTALGKGYKYCK